MPRIVAFSDSRLKNFETCPKKYAHLTVLKDVKEEQSQAQADGLAIHKAFEMRVRRGAPLPERLRRYEPAIAALVGAPGATDRRVFAEMKMAVTTEFAPCEWFDKQTYIRAIIDLGIVRGKAAVLVDYKSGKVHDDFTQLDLQSLMVFWHFPEVEQVTPAFFWVGGKGSLAPGDPILRSQVPALWAAFLPRVAEYQDAHARDHFPARPSGLCRFCPVKACTYNQK